MPDIGLGTSANLRLQRQQGVTILYDDKEAKPDLLSEWRETYGFIRANIASGRAREREDGDVKDIGVRDLGDGDLASISRKTSR